MKKTKIICAHTHTRTYTTECIIYIYNMYTHTHTCTHTNIYIYVYAFVYVQCVVTILVLCGVTRTILVVCADVGGMYNVGTMLVQCWCYAQSRTRSVMVSPNIDKHVQTHELYTCINIHTYTHKYEYIPILMLMQKTKIIYTHKHKYECIYTYIGPSFTNSWV